MAFPGSAQLDLATAWAGLRATAGQIKARAQAVIGVANLSRKETLDHANSLAFGLGLLDSYTAVPGLAAYAQNQINDPAINITAEYTTMRNQIVATQDWLVANFPNTAGELRVYTFDASKRAVDINLTAPQLTALKNQLTALVATIN